MSRENRLIKNTFILAFGTVLPKFSTFLILPIITAALSKSEYGTYDLIVTSLSFILPIFSLMIEQGVFRFLINSQNDTYKKNVITNSFLFVFLGSFLLLIGCSIIFHFFDVKYSSLIVCYILFNHYYRYLNQLCRGLGLVKVYSASSVINSLFNLILIIVFVGQIELGYFGMLLSINISIIASILYMIYKCKLLKYIELNKVDNKLLLELIKYSLPLLPNSLSWWIVSVSDRWLISIYLGIEMTAVYAISSKIPSMFNLLYSNFNLAWQESATLSAEDSDVESYYTNIFNNLTKLLVGLLIILLSIAPIVFDIFIDDSYSEAFYQVPILFLATFFNSLSAFYGGIYIARKMTRSIGISTLFAAIINIILNVIFIPIMGLFAASISTLLAYLLLTIYRAINLQKYVKIKYEISRLLFYFMICMIFFIMVYIDRFYFTIIGCISSVCISLLLNKEIVINIKNKITKK